MTKVSKAAALTPKINMAILGGIIAGVVAGLLYNKFHKIKLPEWLDSLQENVLYQSLLQS